MSTNPAILSFILRQLSLLDEILAKKMFGEYGIYYKGKLVALVCDDQFFLKPTIKGKNFIGTVEERAPYPGAKPCFFLSTPRLEDKKWLAQLIELSSEEIALKKKISVKKY